ncbi:Z1 domain protein [Enhygromyxa salina]|uniref:Z1 domain protein n=1 Tax=Enhygromyxa salina TaxID=215803 RepID=A0A2S9XJY7_9BACT|nr:Z1 domain-containing protein [Enhygromyxa salina]PRP93147.1 Z1 domain protein [Enhygromyxa salina]
MTEDTQYTAFTSMIRGGQTPKAAYDMFRSMFGDEVAKTVYARYEQKVGLIRVLEDPITFSDGRVHGWYAGPSEGDRFWPALEKYIRERKGWPDETVKAIDDATTKILSLMQPPGLGSVDTRGLVVGYVQSGKTANYTALIAKAADVGYRLFIVLAGVHNSLRRQTEQRLRNELVALNKNQWATLTSLEEDFRPSAGGNTNVFLSDSTNLRILCVVKKNAHVLARLLKWLKAGESSVLAGCPVLIIDDEADQAGLNASRDPNSRTVINRRVLEIIDLLPKVAYVGYTATPFANVLVDPSGDDLYPSSFIASLPQSAAYFGAETLFGREPLDEDADSSEREGLDMIRVVPDDEIDFLRPKSAKDRLSFEAEISPSLEQALDYFLLACAARRLRGSESHASMLIHTTLYADPHESIAAKVEEYCHDRLRSLKKDKKSLIGRLRDLWVDEAPCVPASSWGNPTHDFEDLRPLLVDVASETEVVVENAQSLSRLAFGKDAKIQIAVGGNTLSRGLTLEGLLVSFFVRSASAYDTLLQMGRWFGYRMGYEDLPRIWMTEELRSAFFLLATVEQEIRNDIARYDAESLTPKDFGVRIRTHPGLGITSRLKMRSAVDCNVSYANQTKQTRFFKHKDAEWLRANQQAARDLLEAAGEPGMLGLNRVYRDVPVERILEFFANYKVHESHPMLQPNTLGAYIRAQRANNSLTRWNVALVQRGTPSEALGQLTLSEGLTLNLVSRSKLVQSDKSFANLGTIATQSYYNLDLDEDRRSQKLSSRTVEDNPLLVIIPISRTSSEMSTRTKGEGKGKARAALDAVEDILGIALCFPPAKVQTPQRYVTVDLSKIEVDEEDEYIDEEEESA